MPVHDFRGYRVLAETRGMVAAASALACSRWQLFPRFGALVDFEPGADAEGAALDRLVTHHVTVLQAYDWMYRHYRFLAPEDPFIDPLGRCISLDTVRRRVRQGHERGQACLGYAAVYGAEPEYADRHPDEVVRDGTGRPAGLAGLFLAMDPRPGSWRERIMGEFAAAIREAGFDGLHLDQYGTPKRGFTGGDRHPVDLGAEFPGLVREARARVKAIRPDGGVFFNCVNSWPLHQVATCADAVYIEVWPPHVEYAHLAALIREAIWRGEGRPVILAAYLEPWRDGGEGALWAHRLATAGIAAVGGHHLVLVEGGGALSEAYYPRHGRLDAVAEAHLLAASDHLVALAERLYDPASEDLSWTNLGAGNSEFELVGAPFGPEARAGTVWAVLRRRPGETILNLINLLGQPDSRWNTPKRRPPELAGLTLVAAASEPVGRAVWCAPGQPVPTAIEPRLDSTGRKLYRLPVLLDWGTLVIMDAAG
jgi:dextranase